MRIDVHPTDSNHYITATFRFKDTIVESGLLDETECIVLAERLRAGTDSLEHYSRVIVDVKKGDSKIEKCL